MSELLIGESLKFSETNTATRYGELVSTKEQIYDIPTPRLGMRVYVSSEGKEYIIRSLKSKIINGVEVPNAAVGEFEPSDGDITAVNAELLKRIQGTSDETDSRNDSFEFLGGYSTYKELDNALKGLEYGGNKKGLNYGYFRAKVQNHRQVEIKNLLISSGVNYIVQVVSGCFKISDNALDADDNNYCIATRILKRRGTDTYSSWGEWKVIVDSNSISSLETQINSLGEGLSGSISETINAAIENLIGDSGYESLEDIKAAITAEVNRATAEETALQQQIDYIDYVKESPNVSIGGIDKNGDLVDSNIFCHSKSFKGKFFIKTNIPFIIHAVYDETANTLTSISNTEYITPYKDHSYKVVIRSSSFSPLDNYLGSLLNGDFNNTINFFGREKLAEIKDDIAENKSSIAALNNEVTSLKNKFENFEPGSGGGDGVPSETITEIQERLDNFEEELSDTQNYVDEKIEENKKAITDLKDGSSYTMKGLENYVKGNVESTDSVISDVRNNIKEVENSLYNHIDVNLTIGKLKNDASIDEDERDRISTSSLTGKFQIVFNEAVYISEYIEYNDEEIIKYEELQDTTVSSITINTNNYVKLGIARKDGGIFRSENGFVVFAGISKFDAINNKIGKWNLDSLSNLFILDNPSEKFIYVGKFTTLAAAYARCKEIGLANPTLSILKFDIIYGDIYDSLFIQQTYNRNEAIITQFFMYGEGHKHSCKVRHIVTDGSVDEWQDIQLYTSYSYENGTLYGYKYGKGTDNGNKVAIVDIPQGREVDITAGIETYGLPTLISRGELTEGVTYTAKILNSNLSKVELNIGNAAGNFLSGRYESFNNYTSLRIRVFNVIADGDGSVVTTIDAINDKGEYYKFCIKGSTVRYSEEMKII